MSRYQPGDIVEIRLEQGLAYAQLTHEHDSYPPVVRLFRGLSDSRPAGGNSARRLVDTRGSAPLNR